eukprot:gene26582-35250_t
MGLALSSEFQNTWPNNSRGKSLKDSMDAILSTYENLQAEYYPIMAFPVGKYLHALVNGQPIAVDNTPPLMMSILSSLSLLARADTGKLLLNKYEKEIKEEFEAIWNDLKTHILSERGTTANGQVLEDIFPRLFAIDINSVMCTVGGRPYNAANTSSSNYSFVQDGVVRSAKEWLENMFELISNTNRKKKTKTLKVLMTTLNSYK